MPRRLPFSRRVTTAARWPLGVAKTGWDYLWRTTPMHRCEGPGSVPDDDAPPLPPGTDRTDLLGVEEGVGPLLHRSYVVQVREAELTADQLIAAFAAHPNRATPTALARFVKLRGEKGALRVGDEFTVRMPGPWDGPVRVVEVSPTAFSFVTLAGHLEAGRIRFSADDLGPGRLEVRIEAWARGGDRLSNMLFDRLRVNKEVQLHMWTSVLERLTRMSSGRRDGAIQVTTRRVDAEDLAFDVATTALTAVVLDERLAASPRVQRALAELGGRSLNFDPAELEAAGPQTGWFVDDYRQPLPAEAPGEPVPGGTFEIARRLMADYAFADPAIVRAVFDPASGLADRNMLLQARFGPLRFLIGCRVGAVVDETITVDGRAARVWGWGYSTLTDHLEQGQEDFAVWKWLDDGAVEFRIHVVSRRARVGNPVVRLGVRLFGRHQQARFGRRACERMAELVAQELAQAGPPPATPHPD